LSYAASFNSLPEQLIYCEHGNQFDPSNTLVEYANPLDTPVGAHVVTELVRPIGPGAAIFGGLDLRGPGYVFPLAAIPDWIAARIFYQFLGMLLRWLLGPLVVAYAGYEGLAALVHTLGAHWRCGRCSSSWRPPWACYCSPPRWSFSSAAGWPGRAVSALFTLFPRPGPQSAALSRGCGDPPAPGA
jgi:hypothetical protein